MGVGRFAPVVLWALLGVGLAFVGPASRIPWLSALDTGLLVIVAGVLVFTALVRSQPVVQLAMSQLQDQVQTRIVVGVHIALLFLVTSLVFAAAFMASRGAGGQVITGNATCVDNFGNFVYFSFMTASTTGYGDLRPVGLARVVASAQIMLIPVILAGVLQQIWAIVSDVAGRVRPPGSGT